MKQNMKQVSCNNEVWKQNHLFLKSSQEQSDDSLYDKSRTRLELVHFRITCHIQYANEESFNKDVDHRLNFLPPPPPHV